MDNTVATADTAVTSTAATATSAANTATPPTLPTGTAPYTVVQGDSLWKIAHNHKTSVNTLKALNNMTSDMLHPGQTLLVPAK
jgi:LysM repeat protein